MTDRPRLRRLIDLAGIADLEFKALMKPRMAEAEARAEFPEIDQASRDNFGLTADEAEAIADPDGWDGIDLKPAAVQAAAFEAAGWDVTDNKRRPLRMLPQFSRQLWLAVRGVAGELPFHLDEAPDKAESSLARDVKAFLRDRR
jgi:hypothetical protein